MDFAQVAEGIIKDSIVSAICIDDSLKGPFDVPDSENDLNFNIPKSIHQSFKKEHCHLTVYQYKDYRQWKEDRDFEFKNRDLLILDWELQKTAGDKYLDSLKILNQAIETVGIPFVYIYTQAADLHKIPFIIQAYFSGLNKNEAAELWGDIIQEIEDLDDVDDGQDLLNNFAEEIDALRRHNLSTQEKRNINQSISKKLGDITDASNPGKLFGNIKRILNKKLRDIELSPCDFLYLRQNEYFSRDKGPRKKIEFFDSEKMTLIINQNFIKISSKNEGVDAYVDPKYLFQSFTKTVSDSHFNFLIFLALEFRNLYREQAMEVGRNLHLIDETTLLYHLGILGEKAGRYLKHLWKDQVTALWFEKESKMVDSLIIYQSQDHIQKRLESFSVGEKETELSRINYFYSTLQIRRKEGDQIRFGDIFILNGFQKKQNQVYLMCITPHCDCEYPSKIENQFTFIKGVKTRNNKKPLERGDSGFDSYLFDKQSEEIFCIEWGNKPFTLYVLESENKIDSGIKVNYKGIGCTLGYVATQKESYAQRIANHAVSYLLRVGIDLAKLPETVEKK